jgi:TPP-dependent pyruvate/acetoin dehydrogenase alpha subunit
LSKVIRLDVEAPDELGLIRTHIASTTQERADRIVCRALQRMGMDPTKIQRILDHVREHGRYSKGPVLIHYEHIEGR